MLTRDVQLTRAIIDLLDNCIDGAKRLRPNGNFDGLWVRVELDEQKFSIADNCGGIPVKIARDYAFRFGRPKGAEDTPGSMGLFGVGMKRTFFKLGNFFEVKSRCATEEFDLQVDVAEWVNRPEEDPNNWHFQFNSVRTEITPSADSEHGTDIEVTQLHRSISSAFALENFQTQLVPEIKAAHMLSIQRGLGITVNRVPVQFEKPSLLSSEQVQPAVSELAFDRQQIDGKGGEGVKVKLIAGLSERIFQDGGWYIFCNGRLILRADKTQATIWGAAHNMRQYHPDFAYFRGYAFFDSAVSSLLPWTTTKTGVDVDSALYKIVQQHMIEISKPIISFLSGIAKDDEVEEGGLDETLGKATAKDVQMISGLAMFRADVKRAAAGPKWGRIQYSKPFEDIEKAKQLMGVRTLKEVGERSFDYFLEYEGEN